jgi:membrane protein DedA with SNARE-associated domain
MHNILGVLVAWSTDVISRGGYGGIALLMALESACLPIPSEIIVPFAGYLVSIGRFNLYLAATFGALGCNLGSAIAYEVGARGGRPFVRRWGRYILVAERELDQVERLFRKYGAISVLIGRLLPVIRTFIALPAGIARMNRWQFHLYTFIGSWPWCFALAYAGLFLGSRWNSRPALQSKMHRLDGAVVLLLMVAFVYFVYTRIRAARMG